MIELQQVSKSFDGTLVLHPTDLAIEQSRTTVLIGPSGCGKSTLLRLMVGLIKPDAGTVLFDGEELAEARLLESRRRMGFVLQSGGLFPHLTAFDNVALMARCLKRPADEIENRVRELAELTHLQPELLGQFPDQLSGGQRQRVAIMRGLMLDPDVLLLDEPMGALDPLIRFGLQNDLREIFQSLNKTVVLVTHDMGEAGFLGDHVVLLGEGRIVQQGPFEDLVNSPANDFAARFVSAQRNPIALSGKSAEGASDSDR
jgi:osmoprotectant transport system ATP-binding protein